MDSHSPDGSPSNENGSRGPHAEAPKGDVESSVFEALRPLFRPKRREQREDVEPAAEAPAEDRPAEPAAALPYLGADAEPTPTKSEPVPSTFPEAEADASTSSGGSDPMTFDQLDHSKEPETNQGEVVEDEIQTFAAIGEDLERRSRKSATMVRLLEQHRQQLKTAEKERDEAYDKLARVVPVVQETALALREAMDGRKIDIDPGRMHKLFKMNGRALDELEKVSTTLFADFLWLKSAWEQYARSVEDARRFRANLDS